MARDIKFSSVGRDLTDEIINKGRTYKTNKRKIAHISVHCSDSPQGRGDDAHAIDRWHKERWGSGIGYHYVILEDGTIQKGRWVDNMGAGVRGHNRNGIHICRIGGRGKSGGLDNGKGLYDATYEQINSIRVLTELLISEKMYGLSVEDIKGHNEYPGVGKDCPLMKMDRIRNIIKNNIKERN